MSIGKRIQARREELGWSRKELAQRLGMTRMTVWRLENGISGIRADELKAMARVLRTKVTELVA